LSVTPTRSSPPPAVSATITRPESAATNFTAFESRLMITCINRSRSARIKGTLPSKWVSRLTFLSRNS